MFAFLCSGWLALWKIDYFNHFQVLERMCFLSKMLLLRIHSERKNVQFKPKVWARGEKIWRLFVLQNAQEILSDESNTFSSHSCGIACSWIKNPWQGPCPVVLLPTFFVFPFSLNPCFVFSLSLFPETRNNSLRCEEDGNGQFLSAELLLHGPEPVDDTFPILAVVFMAGMWGNLLAWHKFQNQKGLQVRAHNLCHDNRQLIVIAGPAKIIAINWD